MEKSEVIKALQKFVKENPNPYVSHAYRSKKKDEPEEELRSDYWVSGGITGGNCWGDVANRPVDPDDPAEFEQLDKFLEQEFPDISFLNYKKISAKIETAEFGESEYYGNYRDYKYYWISFEDLAEVICDIENNKKQSKQNKIQR